MFCFKFFGLITILFVMSGSAEEEHEGVVRIEKQLPGSIYSGDCYDFKATLFRNGTEENDDRRYSFVIRDQNHTKKFVASQSSYDFVWKFLYVGMDDLYVVVETDTNGTQYTYEGHIRIEVIGKTHYGNLSLQQRGVYLRTDVNPNEDFTFNANVSAEILKDAKYVTTFWYENCTTVDESNGTSNVYIFGEMDQVYEMVGVVVITLKGAPPRESPYICRNNVVQEEEIDVGTQMFQCSGLPSTTLSVTCIFRGNYVTRVRKDLSSGTIFLRQNDIVLNGTVGTKEAVTMELKLDADDERLMKRSKNVKIFWFINCKLLDDYFESSLQYTFNNSNEEYEIIGLMVGSYEDPSPVVSPYICENDTLESEVAPQLTALFRTKFKTRDLHINSKAGDILLDQHGTIRTNIVATSEELNMSMKVEDILFRKSSKILTFWYRNCELLGNASNTNFTYNFVEADQRQDIIGVLVMVYEGMGPNESPYNCTNDSVQENIKYAVGLYKSHFTTKDTRIGGGPVVLTQAERIREHFVTTNDIFDLSIHLEANETRALRKFKTRTTFWYSNCTLLGKSIGLTYRFRFNEAFQTYQIACILLATISALIPHELPYNCENNTVPVNEYANYTVGVYRSTYFSVGARFKRGIIILTQNDIILEGLIASGIPTTLSVLLAENEGIILKNSKAMLTFWHTNCSLMGINSTMRFETKFNKVNQLHHILVVLVAILDGEAPKEVPYNCSRNAAIDEVNENYIIGTYRSQFYTKEPIRITGVIGRTALPATQRLHLKITFTGSQPCQYCTIVFPAGYTANGNEECPKPTTECKGHHFVYIRKFSKSKVVVIIISNDVSREVKSIPITIATIRRMSLVSRWLEG